MSHVHARGPAGARVFYLHADPEHLDVIEGEVVPAGDGCPHTDERTREMVPGHGPRERCRRCGEVVAGVGVAAETAAGGVVELYDAEDRTAAGLLGLVALGEAQEIAIGQRTTLVVAVAPPGPNGAHLGHDGQQEPYGAGTYRRSLVWRCRRCGVWSVGGLENAGPCSGVGGDG